MSDEVDIERFLFIVQPVDDPVASGFERAIAGEIAGQLCAFARIFAEVVNRGADELLYFGRELGYKPRRFRAKADADHRSAAEHVRVGYPPAGARLANRFL